MIVSRIRFLIDSGYLAPGSRLLPPSSQLRIV
jgi:hypothetical protein